MQHDLMAILVMAAALCAGAALVLCYQHWKAQKLRQDDHLTTSPEAGDPEASRRARKTGRWIVYFVSMPTSFAIFATVDPFVSRFEFWQTVRNNSGWALLLGAVLVAALIFFILQLGGVYLHAPITTTKPKTPLDLENELENELAEAVAGMIAVVVFLIAFVACEMFIR
jgi:hypothetical protein